MGEQRRTGGNQSFAREKALGESSNKIKRKLNSPPFSSPVSHLCLLQREQSGAETLGLTPQLSHLAQRQESQLPLAGLKGMVFLRRLMLHPGDQRGYHKYHNICPCPHSWLPAMGTGTLICAGSCSVATRSGQAVGTNPREAQ